jgi:hypothetical protein
LEIFHVTHYIWVKDDGSAIVMTGPDDAVDTLLRVSNLAANRQATEDELDELRIAFSLGTVSSPIERKWVTCERTTAVVVLLMLALVCRQAKQELFAKYASTACGVCVATIIKRTI